MADFRDHHATIFVAPEVAGQIETVRREWDPDMAAQIAAHVTLAYPKEAPISGLLLERVREASITIPPFRLRLHGVACFERPDGGVFVSVEDIDGGYRQMREEVLRHPFRGDAHLPHVTLVRPRTSRRGREFWDSGCYRQHGQEFTTEEVAITAFDGVRWVTLMTFALAGSR
jgi:2'-5' RNA ligase